MKKHKPRGPVPSLIGSSNGKPRRIQVLGKSQCSRCHTLLIIGTMCVAIPKIGTGYSNPKRVCDGCFQEILQKTSEDFEAVKAL